MVLDECPKLTNNRDKLKSAIEISTKWAKRCKIEFGNNKKNFVWYYSRRIVQRFKN